MTTSTDTKSHKAIFYSICAAAFIFLLFKSWVAEDAFISARVIDNFINGYGLRWNIDERVQVYTHPLWLLIHIPFYFLSGEFFYTSIIIGLICSISAVILLLKTAKLSPSYASLFIILPLIVSRAISDYATSGLENSLSYLLIAAFCYLLFTKKQIPWFYLSLIAALAATNRLDTALLYAPIMLYLIVTNLRQVRWTHIIIGITPLLAWEIFSLIYYGFLLPNTAYAKLNTGYDLDRFIAQGLLYVKNFVLFDAASFALIIITFITAIFSRNTHKPHIIALMIGVLLYCIYIICVGGDYMSGRFFSVPVFICVIILALIIAQSYSNYLLIIPAFLLICFAASTAYIFSKHHVFIDNNGAEYFIDKATGIHDERGWAWRTNHLISLDILKRGQSYQDNRLAKKGLKYRNRGELCGQPACYVAEYYAIGMAGYMAGANVIIIDEFALTDALLARIRNNDPAFAPGHYFRHPPTGYNTARRTDSMHQMHPSLQEYYQKLRLITAGKIFTRQRFTAIYDFMFDDKMQNLLDKAIAEETHKAEF